MVAFKFIEWGLGQCLEFGYGGTMEKRQAHFRKLIGTLITNVSQYDDINTFLPGMELITNLAALSKDAPSKQECWDYITEDRQTDPPLFQRLVQHSSIQIITYYLNQNPNAIDRLVDEMHSNPKFGKCLVGFRFEEGQNLRPAHQMTKMTKTTQFLLSYQPIRSFFLNSAIDGMVGNVDDGNGNHNNGQNGQQKNNTVKNGKPAPSFSSPWIYAINDRFSPSNSILNALLKPFIPDLQQRLCGFDFHSYLLINSDSPYLPTSATFRLESSWKFVLNEILIPRYQEYQQEQLQLQEPSSSSNNTTTYHNKSIPTTPNSPVPMKPIGDLSTTTHELLFGWYLYSNPRRVQFEGLSRREVRANMAHHGTKFQFSLIFFLLLAPHHPHSYLSSVFFPQLFSAQKEYPVNLNQRIRLREECTAVVEVGCQQNGNNHSNQDNDDDCKNTTITLSPLQFTVLRYSFVEPDRINPDTAHGRHEIERAEQEDSILIEFMIESYIESIIEGTVDQIHPPCVYEIEC